MSDRSESLSQMVAAREEFVTNARTTGKYGTPRHHDLQEQRQKQGKPAARGRRTLPTKSKTTSKATASGARATSSIPPSATSGPTTEPKGETVQEKQINLTVEVKKIDQPAPASSPVTSAQTPSALSRRRPSAALYVSPPLREKLLRQQQNSTLDSANSLMSEFRSLHQPAGRRAPPCSQRQTRGHSERRPSNLQNEVLLSPDRSLRQTHPAKTIPISMSSPIHTKQQGSNAEVNNQKENRKQVVVKMSTTSEEETVIHKGRRGQQDRVNNHQNGAQTTQIDPATPSSSRQPAQQTARFANNPRNNYRPPNTPGKKTLSPQEEAAQEAELAKYYKPLDPVLKAELQQLQQDILQKAHQNRFKDADFPVADPKFMEICRGGPGNDPNSEAFEKIAVHRYDGQTRSALSIADPDAGEQPSFEVADSPGAAGLPTIEENAAQWKEYADSRGVYPDVVDGEVVFSSEPSPAHLEMQEKARIATEKLRTGQQDCKHRWEDAWTPEWETRPRLYSDLDEFISWFRRWMDGTLALVSYTDIYHESFFDGTAHPDGVRGFLIPNLGDVETRIDMTVEETRLHRHESAEGYCYNLALHQCKEEEERLLKESIRRERAWEIYIQTRQAALEPHPLSPRANIYLRHALPSDAAELLEIFNHYISEGPESIGVDLMETGDVRQRIDDCHQQSLPFLVAAERRTGPIRDDSPEKILGYALASDFAGRRTAARYTAELELFVKPEAKRKGIGRCLMDKLLGMCDPTYNPKGGYSFEVPAEYTNNGERQLARLTFALSYPVDDTSTYTWVKGWLHRAFEFEEQGLLRGSRVKFGKYQHVSYLVRSVGYSEGVEFDR